MTERVWLAHLGESLSLEQLQCPGGGLLRVTRSGSDVMCLPLGHRGVGMGKTPVSWPSWKEAGVSWRKRAQQGGNLPTPWTLPHCTAILCFYVSFGLPIRLRDTQAKEECTLSLSQFQKETRIHSLEKGEKESPQALQACGHVAFASTAAASWVSAPQTPWERTLAPPLLKPEAQRGYCLGGLQRRGPGQATCPGFLCPACCQIFPGHGSFRI